MLDSNSSGTYTKTSGYNFLKNLLGIPKNAFLNKSFFNLFFTESEGFYIIKKPEEKVKSIIFDNGIIYLNNLYYKKRNKKEFAEILAKEILSIIKKEMN